MSQLMNEKMVYKKSLVEIILKSILYNITLIGFYIYLFIFFANLVCHPFPSDFWLLVSRNLWKIEAIRYWLSRQIWLASIVLHIKFLYLVLVEGWHSDAHAGVPTQAGCCC